MRSKVASNENPISIRYFLRVVQEKRARVQLHYFREGEPSKSFSVADVVVDRIKRDGEKITFEFGNSWLLVKIKNEDVWRFYNGDVLYYCIEADGVEVFVNMI